jgi:hypothetical protein
MKVIASLCPVAIFLIVLNLTSCQSPQFKQSEAPAPKPSPIKAAGSKKELITEEWYKQQFEKAGLTKHWNSRKIYASDKVRWAECPICQKEFNGSKKKMASRYPS